MYYGHMSFKIAQNDAIEKQKSYLVLAMSVSATGYYSDIRPGSNPVSTHPHIQLVSVTHLG
jgi:hypothetical protein